MSNKAQDANDRSPLISQIVRAATSIGANYMEADGAESKKDFQHKISICYSLQFFCPRRGSFAI